MDHREHRRAIAILAERGVFQPSIVPGLGDTSGYIVFSSMKVLGRGPTIRDALNAALASGFVAPARYASIRFKAEGNEVIQHDAVVATCKSKTFAARVANALNVYNPNERGM